MRKLLLGLAFFLLALNQLAGAQTLSPTADAYVLDGTWANSNFGTAAEMYAKTSNGQNYDSYLKFDTSSVGGAGSVASAKLRIAASMSGGSAASVSAYAVSDTTWSETGITWNNKPVRGAALGSMSVLGNTFTYYEIDVSNYVISEKAAGRNIVSFALHKPASGSQLVWMKTRETGFGQPPELVITPNAAPTVSLTAPASGAVFLPGQGVPVTASAADSDGTIAKVEFFDGATLAATVTAAPYTVTLTGLASGTHSLTAKATDNLGLATTSAAVSIRVDAAPTVSITAPANGSVFFAPASFALTASASDSDGTVTKVDFYDGATLLGTVTAAPYSVNVSGLAAGVHSLSAVATDNDGATTTTAISVTVDAPPSVAITSPASGASFNAPANITVTATAADTDGTVTNVQFFANGNPIGTATASPFTISWANVAQGSYSLTAVATDNQGATTTSAAVPITVANAQPALHFIQVDHLNTVRLIADDQQRTVWRFDNQEPFGDSPPDENPIGLGIFEFPLGFVGTYRDKESGRLQNWHRNLDPSIARYLEADRIGILGLLGRQGILATEESTTLLAPTMNNPAQIPGQPAIPTPDVRNSSLGGASLNLYGHVSANPLSFTDPTGELAIGTALNSSRGGAAGAGSANAQVCQLDRLTLCRMALNGCFTAYRMNFSMSQVCMAQYQRCVQSSMSIYFPHGVFVP